MATHVNVIAVTKAMVLATVLISMNVSKALITVMILPRFALIGWEHSHVNHYAPLSMAAVTVVPMVIYHAHVLMDIALIPMERLVLIITNALMEAIPVLQIAFVSIQILIANIQGVINVTVTPVTHQSSQMVA